jgi:hypothetical protein
VAVTLRLGDRVTARRMIPVLDPVGDDEYRVRRTADAFVYRVVAIDEAAGLAYVVGEQSMSHHQFIPLSLLELI